MRYYCTKATCGDLLGACSCSALRTWIVAIGRFVAAGVAVVWVTRGIRGRGYMLYMELHSCNRGEFLTSVYPTLPGVLFAYCRVEQGHTRALFRRSSTPSGTKDAALCRAISTAATATRWATRQVRKL